jgi:hypothetical protein
MSRGDYEDRQRERDREYADAWGKLSAKERRQLAKMGITGPDLPVYHTGKHDQETLLDRCVAPVVTSTEPAASSANDTAVSDETQAAIRRLVGELLARDNARLTIECLCLVTNIGYDGSTMTAIGRRCGVTRAAVSKRCVDVSNAMNLPPSRAMRRLTARATYGLRARKHHERKIS